MNRTSIVGQTFVVTTSSRAAARRTVVTVLVVVAGVALTGPPALASSTRCVGHARGCYSSLQAAVDASSAGDVIRVRRGTYRGGVTISKSLHVIGAGAWRSVIRGGGPVLTIASPTAASRPHVTISGVTITGGDAHGDGVVASGGGILVSPVPGGPYLGGTVSLRHVVVAGNRATPTTTSSSPSGVKCPTADCPFALANGGGIANFGHLNLSHVLVARNLVGGRASDAIGGGIYNERGSISVDHSVIGGNRAQPASIGRFAEGGGIFLASGALSVHRSRITHNHAILVTSWPVRGQGEVIEMNANSGGVHVGDGARAVVVGSRLDHNSANADDPRGEPVAFDSAMLVGDSTLAMRGSTIGHNSVTNRSATADDVGASGSALELDGPGTITQSRIVDNPVHTYSQNGSAAANAGLAVLNFSGDPRQVTLSHSVVRGNSAVSNSTHGSAFTAGGGILNNSLLTVRHTLVKHNHASAYGPHATVQGGGVWNGVLLSGPPVVLRLLHSLIVGNRLSGSAGATRQGGGLYTSESLTRVATPIRHNRPDQCHGCNSTQRHSNARLLPRRAAHH